MVAMTEERIYLENVIGEVIRRLSLDVKTEQVYVDRDDRMYEDQHRIRLMFNGDILSEEWIR